MLINFCDPRMKPIVHCDTVSLEGFDETNLINGNDKGFVAYPCMRPPVNIDLTFICNIQIHHIIITSSVGSQKSSGIQLSVKKERDDRVPFDIVSTGYLDRTQTGWLFLVSNIDSETISSIPSTFLKCSIKTWKSRSYVNSIRICICKTDNSVPALGKIEVWGSVSPILGKNTVKNIQLLWQKQNSLLPTIEQEKCTKKTEDIKNEKCNFEIPEQFLDPITCEIMTQPILLPSGKIIDLTTLKKHEETEAIWGRHLSDPFTGLLMTSTRKPIMANKLKIQIDKFLLENSNEKEIRKIPRVLGGEPSICNPNSDYNFSKPISTIEKNCGALQVLKNDENRQLPISNERKVPQGGHKLPICLISKPKSYSKPRPAKLRKISNLHDTNSNSTRTQLTANDPLNGNIKEEFSNSQKFIISTNNQVNDLTHNLDCKCCEVKIYYKLPCEHIICRNALLENISNHCLLCNTAFSTDLVVRVHSIKSSI